MAFFHERLNLTEFTQELESWQKEDFKREFTVCRNYFWIRHRRELIILAFIGCWIILTLNRPYHHHSIYTFSKIMLGSVLFTSATFLMNQLFLKRLPLPTNRLDFFKQLESMYQYELKFYTRFFFFYILPMFTPAIGLLSYNFFVTKNIFNLGLMLPLIVLAFALYDNYQFLKQQIRAEFKFYGPLVSKEAKAE